MFSGKDNHFKGFVLSLAGTFLVSTNFVTARYSLYGFEPVTFSLVWTFFSTVHSFAFVIGTGRANQVKIAPASRTGLALLGLTTGLAMIWGWTALSILDPSFQAFLNRFAPVLAIFFGVLFLKEKITGREIAAIVVMVAGGVISTIGTWQAVATGIFFALLSFIMIALQHLIAKTAVSSVHVTVIVFYRSMLAFLVILLWGVIRGGFDFEVPLRYWLTAALGAFLGPCFSHILYFRSFSFWELSRSSMVSNIQPLFVIPMAYMFLGEFPEKMQLIGGMIILAGILWLGWIHLNSRSVPGPED